MTVFRQQPSADHTGTKGFPGMGANQIAARAWRETCSRMHAMGTRQKRADEAADYRSALLAERARITGGTLKELEILVLPASLALDDQAPLMHDQFVALRQHRMDHSACDPSNCFGGCCEGYQSYGIGVLPPFLA